MNLEDGGGMVGEEFIQRWVRRVRHQVPDGVAVFLVGSYARGDGGPYSDVDLDVLVAEGPRNEWPTWFEVEEHRLVCVSVWIRDVALGDRGAAPPPRRHLRRGHLAGPHRRRPNCDACLRNLVIGLLDRADRSTSPPSSAATPATPADPWPASGSAWDETESRQNDGALRAGLTDLAL
jgi:hypothetical protein